MQICGLDICILLIFLFYIIKLPHDKIVHPPTRYTSPLAGLLAPTRNASPTTILTHKPRAHRYGNCI